MQSACVMLEKSCVVCPHGLGKVCLCVCVAREKGREEYCCSCALLAQRKEDMEVESREKEKEVPLQHSECEGDLRLVSSSRVSVF